MIKVAGDVVESLNHAGKEGWEVASFLTQQEDGLVFLVKRQASPIQIATELPPAGTPILSIVK